MQSAACTVPFPAGTLPNTAQQLGPGYWRCDFWVVDLDTLEPETYCKGEKLFNGNFDPAYFSVFSNFSGSGSPAVPMAAVVTEPAVGESSIDLSGLPHVLTINSQKGDGIFAKFASANSGNEPTETAANVFQPYPYFANAAISYTAPADDYFTFLWDFTLEEAQDDLVVQNPALEATNLFGDAAVSVFYSVNGSSFRIINGEPLEGFTTASDAVSAFPESAAASRVIDPVAVSESQIGRLNIPLRAGDILYIVAMWDSPSRATFRLMGDNIVSTSNNSCVAHAYIPPLYAADICRSTADQVVFGKGVKQVKATIEDLATTRLFFDPVDGCWISHEKFELPKREGAL